MRRSHVYTDALRSYDGLSERYVHETIDHAKEYVRGRVQVHHRPAASAINSEDQRAGMTPSPEVQASGALVSPAVRAIARQPGRTIAFHRVRRQRQIREARSLQAPPRRGAGVVAL
jgi:hypothetical protein